MKLRVGDTYPEMIYLQLGDRPSKRDPHLGTMVSSAAASALCAAAELCGDHELLALFLAARDD